MTQQQNTYLGRQLPDLLTPAEVAAMFRVCRTQVTRWAQQGKLTSVRTLGNHRRYRTSEVLAYLNQPGDQS